MKNRIFCLIIFLIGVTNGVAQNNKTFAEDFIINANVYSLGGEFKNNQYQFVIYNKVDTSKNVKLPPLNSLDARVFTLCFTGSFKSKFYTNMRAHDSLEVFLHAADLQQKATAFFNTGNNQDPHAGLFILKDTIPVFLNDMNVGVPRKLKFGVRREVDYKLYDTVISVTSKCVGKRIKTSTKRKKVMREAEIEKKAHTNAANKRCTDIQNSLNNVNSEEAVLISSKAKREGEYNTLITNKRTDIATKKGELMGYETAVKAKIATKPKKKSQLKKWQIEKDKIHADSAKAFKEYNVLSAQMDSLKKAETAFLKSASDSLVMFNKKKKELNDAHSYAQAQETAITNANVSRYNLGWYLDQFRTQKKIIRKDSCFCNFYNKDSLAKHKGDLVFNIEQHRNCLKEEIKNILRDKTIANTRCGESLNYYDVYNGFIKSEPKATIKLDEKELFVLTKSRLDDLKDHVEYLKKNKICEKLDVLTTKKTDIDNSLNSITAQLEALNINAGTTIKEINSAVIEIESELDTNCIKKTQVDLIKNDFNKIKAATKLLNIDSIFSNNGVTIIKLKKILDDLKIALDSSKKLQMIVQTENDSTLSSLKQGRQKKNTLNKKEKALLSKLEKCEPVFLRIKSFTDNLAKLNEQLESIGEQLNETIRIKTKLEAQSKDIGKLITDNVNGAQKYLHYFYTDTCQVEFAAGTIKNITVFGEYDGKRYTLVNRYPISISSRSEPEDFKRVKLYEPNSFKFWAFLNNIVHYIPVLTPNSEDYTPEESVQNFKAGENAYVLNKEKATEILKGRVFTDFMGIDPRNPNGLIQTEISKKVNLYTRVFEPLKKRHRIGSLNKYNIYFSVGSYYEPKILVSKIEANNRSLPTLYSDSLVYDGNNNLLLTERRKFVPTLQLIRYSFFSIKPINFNLGSVSFPKAKTSLYLDFGASWYLTSVSDTSATTSGGNTVVEKRNDIVNSLSLNFDFVACIKPDTRYGFVLTASYIHYKLFDRRYYQAGNPDFYGQYLEKRDLYPSIFNLRLDAFYRPFKRVDGEIFFRFNSFILFNDARQNFMQAQLGTAIRFLR